MDESRVRTLLDDLAEAPQPPSSIDVDRAQAEGGRAVRHRRRGAVAAALLAVCAIAFGLVRLVPVFQPDIAVPPAPTTFSVHSRYATFGWVPEGLTRRLTEVQSNYQTVTVFDSRGGVGVTLAVGDMAAYNRAQESNAPVENPGETRWEYAPGGWAQVNVFGLPGDPRELARKIAAGVRFGVNEPFRADLTDTPDRPVKRVFLDEDLSNPAWWKQQLNLDGPGAGSVGIVSGVPIEESSWPMEVEGKPARLDEGDSGLRVREGDQVQLVVRAQPGTDRLEIYRRVHIG